MRLLLALAAAALASMAASAGAEAPRAAMFRGGPALAGLYDATPPHSLKGVRFTFATGGPIRTIPAVAGGILYLGSSDHQLYALDASTGRLLWRFDSGGVIASSPAVAGELVYVTNRAGTLFALNRKSGALKWRATLGADLGPRNYWDFYMSSPSVAGGALYIGSGDGRVRALDARSGRTLWSYDAGSRVRSTPAVAEDRVVFGTQDGHVVGLDRATGAERWKYATLGAARKFADRNNDTTSVYASPTVSGGVVVIGGRDGYAYGLDVATGREKWKITHDGASWILSTAADDGIAYIGSGSAAILQAVDLATGRERWRFKIAGAMFGSPALVGDMLLANDFGGNLYALDREGREYWRFPLGNRGFSTPVAVGSIVYAGSDEGTLYALDVSAAGTPPPPVKRLVYWEAGRDDDAFEWFQNGIDRALLGSFELAGYERIDGSKMKAAMEAQIAGGGRSVIVFAADRVPAAVLGEDGSAALLRRYLDAGGHVVFLGNNPLLFKYAGTGALVAPFGGAAEAALGLHYPSLENERGYHISTPTAEGRRWGLRRDYVANGAIAPSEVTKVLGLNEFGLATSWVKSYGSRGGSLVQLSAPGLFIGPMDELHIAAEHSILE